MKNQFEYNFAGIKKEEISPVERVKMEHEILLSHSKSCGIAAYGEITKASAKDLEPIYKEYGSILENSIKNGFIYFGDSNHRAKNKINTPADYLNELGTFLDECQKKTEEAEAATPEFIEETTENWYRSKVDKLSYSNTKENWKYHMFADKKENYEAYIEEIKATISGFAEAALKAGDNDTYNLAQQITQNF